MDLCRKHSNCWQQNVILLLTASILTVTICTAQVYVEPNTALLNEGDRTELLCRYEHKINYCRIEIPGEKVLNLSPNWSKTPGFTYFGKGLEAGECGVSIDRVKGTNNGKVKCNLGVEGEEKTGLIDLVVAIRPQQPIFELISKPRDDREPFFVEGTQFHARCIVRDGRPAANITWLLDEYPTDKSVSHPEILASQNPNEVGLATTVQEIQWHLTPEDNGRKLSCRSYHQTDRENVPPQEAAYPLRVRFAPVRKTESIVYGLYLGHTALVNVTIRSNPAPVVEWTADGSIIGQGQQNGRYSAFEPVPLGQDYYNVSLVIAGLTPEDTANTYQLRASNALGTTDYQVRISSSSTPPTAGLDIGAIVGIVVAIAVLILVVLLIIFAKATNRWCFGAKSIKSPKPETSDTESADINAASTATTATTAATTEQQAQQQQNQQSTTNENASAKKSKSGLELFNALFKRVHEKYGSEKRGGGADRAELADAETLDEPTAVIQIDNPDNENKGDIQNKQDKQLVYAELILKPAAGVEEQKTGKPQIKNATEYAEIVYVQKPSAETSANKQHN